MARRGHLHHIDLTVRDPERSCAFYEAVLGFMGYRLSKQDARGFDFELEDRDRFCSIGIVRAEGAGRDRPHDRYAPGLHHLALHAESRSDVDALFALLLRIDATILDPPADYPHYGAGTYAVFFADPDGLKLEYVFSP